MFKNKTETYIFFTFLAEVFSRKTKPAAKQKLNFDDHPSPLTATHTSQASEGTAARTVTAGTQPSTSHQTSQGAS